MAIAATLDTRSGAEILARMERLPVSAWHVKARIIVGIGTFFDAVDIMAITYALPAFVDGVALYSRAVRRLVSDT